MNPDPDSYRIRILIRNTDWKYGIYFIKTVVNKQMRTSSTYVSIRNWLLWDYETNTTNM